MVGADDFKDLFQSKKFYSSINLSGKVSKASAKVNPALGTYCNSETVKVSQSIHFKNHKL